MLDTDPLEALSTEEPIEDESPSLPMDGATRCWIILAIVLGSSLLVAFFLL